MKKLLFVVLLFCSCGGNTIDIFTDLSCFDCIVKDQSGVIVSIDTTRAQNFWLQGWLDNLAEWDLVGECWKVNCNTGEPL